jgi:MYND finger
MFEWRHRMSGPFVGNELSLTRSILCMGWRALPADTLGLCKLLNFLAEDAETADLMALLNDETTLATIKLISQHNFNTERRLGQEGFGELYFSKPAKEILVRVSRNVPHHEATTSGLDRALGATAAAASLGLRSEEEFMRGIAAMFTPRQPARDKDEMQSDRRRICDAPGCNRVEGNYVKFGKCAHCKAVAYCSKECQVKDWKGGHKLVCSNKKCASS